MEGPKTSDSSLTPIEMSVMSDNGHPAPFISGVARGGDEERRTNRDAEEEEERSDEYCPPHPMKNIDYADFLEGQSIDADMVDPIISARPRNQQWKANGSGKKRPLIDQRTMDQLTDRIGRVLSQILSLTWRILEVHMSKIVFLIVLWFVAYNVAAMYFPLVILLTLVVCLPASLAGVISVCMCAYLCAIAISQAIFQLHVFRVDWIDTWGTNETCNRTEVNGKGNETFIEWIGFRKEDSARPITVDIILAVLALAAQSVVCYRAAFQRQESGHLEERAFIGGRRKVFPELAPADLHKSLGNLMKWCVDYAFYKFGVEFTIILMSIDAWVRMDFLGAIVLVFLIIVALSPRRVVRAIWPVFTLYLAMIIPLQYALFVGLPPRECIDYPWAWDGDEAKRWQKHLVVWLNLADYDVIWSAGYIFADFILLMAVSAQLFVFREEPSTPSKSNQNSDDNFSIYFDGDYSIKKANPHYDFVTKQESLVDFLKIAIFQYGHWVTLLMVLVAGLGGTSLFALGYICLSFYLLWEGNSLYDMRNHRSTISRWRGLVVYTVIVMFFKVSLQIIGCVFSSWVDELCFLKQLFSITCVSTNVFNSDKTAFLPDNECTVEANETRIGYDTLALAFLVFQLRILNSWYFQHCSIEFRSEIVLANRGAVLKNQLIEKEMKEQNEQQQRKFDDIKERTAAIRDRYDKMQKEGVHFVEPASYGQAKRGGDYYMFDYDPAKDEPGKDVESFVPEVDPESTEFKKLDPSQLVHTAIMQDVNLKDTVQQVESAERIKDDEQRMLEAVKRRNQKDEGKDEEGKLIWLLRFVWKVIGSGLDWFSAFLNRRSREHRYVAYVLQKEKQILKNKNSETLRDVNRPLSDLLKIAKNERSYKVVHSESDISRIETEAINNWQRRSVVARLVNAIGYCISAHTDIVCYLLAVIAHARCGGVITLPLPLMVFFWGTLSNPRPSKFFWVTMIAYTEFCVVVKFICQFGFLPWAKLAYGNKNTKNSYDYPKMQKVKAYSAQVLGIQKTDYATFWETALLMALFFHRYMLRKLGLWKDANVSETFGVDVDSRQMSSIENMDTLSPLENRDTLSPLENRDTLSPLENRDTLSPLENGDTVSPPIEPSVDRVTSPSLKSLRSLSELEDHADYDRPPTIFHCEPSSARETAETKGGVFRFIYQLFSPKFRYIRDLYPAMFGLDIICFLIITFGYSAFGDGGSGSVVSDIQSNRVPLAFVIMLIISSFMIVIDRGLYLRKAVYAKLFYQISIIVFMHIWIFFVLPTMTETPAHVNRIAQFLYVVKCIYLLVSAWQIRNGYPTLCIGNLLMHSYGLLNMVFFKIFMAIPFLWELRTTIDWTWTDTSMPLFDYFNMENFYATIYNIKCARTFEQEYPAPRGEKKGTLVKYMMGLPIVIIIVLLIWCPLLAFSLLNRIGQVLTPETALLSVSIEGYPPLYTIQAQGLELRPVSDAYLSKLKENTSMLFNQTVAESVTKSRSAVAFVEEYKNTDVLFATFRPESQSFWEISSESLIALKTSLVGNTTLKFNVHLEFTRPRADDTKEPVIHTRDMQLEMDDDMKGRLMRALGGDEQANVVLPNSLPPFIQVPNEGEVKEAKLLLSATVMNDPASNVTYHIRNTFASINMRLNNPNKTNEMIWSTQLRYDVNNTPAIAQLLPPPKNITYGPNTDRSYVQVVAFVDRVFPSFANKFVQGGIIAMYVAVVVFVGRTLRGIFTSSPMEVQITEIPNPDYLFKICLDIYLVREAKDFILEQDLYAKLIFLFRSPATLIKWTRMKPKFKTD